jgi:hypothetical protein
MEDFSLRQSWRLTNVLFKARNGELTARDGKNEDRTDYVHENTGEDDNMSVTNHGFLQKKATIAH